MKPPNLSNGPYLKTFRRLLKMILLLGLGAQEVALGMLVQAPAAGIPGGGGEPDP